MNMPGMMSSGDLEALDEAPDGTFEGMWLLAMIAHHEGAIEMAEAEIADGANEEALALAADIIAAQTAEIATMKSMLGA